MAGLNRQAGKNGSMSISFLDLPPEIRILIYNHLTPGRDFCFTTHGSPRPLHFKLTNLCRQIRHEFLAQQCHTRQLHICCETHPCAQTAAQYLKIFGPSAIPLIKFFTLSKSWMEVGVDIDGAKVAVSVTHNFGWWTEAHVKGFEEQSRAVADWGMRRREDGSYFVGTDVIESILDLMDPAHYDLALRCWSD